MRLSMALAHSGGDAYTKRSAHPDGVGAPHGIGRRRMILALALALVLGSVGLLFGPAKPAGASTVFASGQVFASVGNSAVNVYDPASAKEINTLSDTTGETFTAGSAFDAKGNLYVADDLTGQISEYAPDGSSLGVFASGMTNPISPVFDQAGNLFVGQEGTPYIAEFNPAGQRVANIGPVSTAELGDDWIDLSGDQCTVLYTTESDQIYRYDKCTNTQLPALNQAPLPGSNAYQVKIMANQDVLVADTDSVLMLDPSGNIINTYSCASLPGCAGGIFNVAIDPNGTSFWTDDFYTGLIWQVDMATGTVMQTIGTGATYLSGLSVDYGYTAAATETAPSAPPSTLNIQPVTGNFSTPTPVSAVLTNSEGAPIVNEPVVFTLNGNNLESCSATTDASGTASCPITATEPSSTYTLAASFAGDSSISAPVGSSSSTSSFTITPDTTAVTYTGPTTAVNGQPLTLTGTLTTDTPTTGTPLPTKVVTLTIGSGSTAQSCSGTTDANGNVTTNNGQVLGCTIPTVDQPASNEPITASFNGDVYDTSASVTTSATVTEPTTLTVNAATNDYSDATTVSGVLKDAVTNAPISGEAVTLLLNGSESCTATTDATGTASCSITPGEPAGTYPLTGSFAGDTALPLQLMASNGSANFVVTLEETALTYTGATVAQNGQPITLSGVLTTDNPVPGSGLAGRTVTFTLGSGSTAQTCSGTTAATGAASCTVTVANQPQGPIPVTDGFAGDAYYLTASASSTVNLPEGTSLTVTQGSGSYNGPTTVSATLVNSYTNAPVPGEPVTLTLNGTQTCTATTNSAGVASCSVTPNEPAGTYSLTASFAGDTSTTPVLLASSGSGTFVEAKATTTLTYTGSTTTTSGQPPSLSATLTTAGGTPLPGQSVTFTVGTGTTAQKCTATTNSAGRASCNICMYYQSASPLPVTVTYGGTNYYSGSSALQSVAVVTPTSLTVYATTGATGQPTTLSGTLANSVTGQGIGGQTVTLTLDGIESCTATTASNGRASCTVTPTQVAGTYPVTGSFSGNTTTSPQLLASGGHNNAVITAAPTQLTYTGATSAQNGTSVTLSATLTSNGAPLSGQTVALNLGSGSWKQSCSATTNAAGSASCTVASVNQIAGSVPVTAAYGGNSLYQSSTTSGTVKVSNCGGSGGGSSGGSGGGGSPCGGGGFGGYCTPPPTGGGRGCG